MKYTFGRTIVIALGGSIICPDGVDHRFLKKFRNFISPFLKEGQKFVLVVGGGKIARDYQKAASAVMRVPDEDKDWIGIHATRLNAHLIRTIFRDVADPVVIDQRHKIKRLRYPVTIASGWRPGWSTDYIAVALAEDFGAHEAVIAGKPRYVYDKDNTKYGNAKPLAEMSWKEYRKLIPHTWAPGIHAPVDPVAAKLASEKKICALIIGGSDLANFGKLLRGETAGGTLIAD